MFEELLIENFMKSIGNFPNVDSSKDVLQLFPNAPISQYFNFFPLQSSKANDILNEPKIMK